MPSYSTPPSTIDKATFEKALKAYPSVVEKAYALRFKDDAKKVADALERDRWRYEELPGRFNKKGNGKQSGKADGLTKDEVEKLVLWKISHGQNRPFLPSMVRKNDAEAISTQTSFAQSQLASGTSPPSLSSITTALGRASKLTGIGPATASLILSVFDPLHVPFFQDELYAWFCAESAAGKLKYSAKEYTMLVEKVGPTLKRLNAKAIDLEKVAYVLGHLDLLGEEERKTLEESFDGESEDQGKIGPPEGATKASKDTVQAGDAKKKQIESTTNLQQQSSDTKPDRKREREWNIKEDTEAQAPKRRSQRKR